MVHAFREHVRDIREQALHRNLIDGNRSNHYDALMSGRRNVYSLECVRRAVTR